MRETQEVTIDGENYIVGEFPATQGLSILYKLLNLAGTGLGDMVKASEKGKDQEISVFADVAGKIISNMNEKDVKNLAFKLVEQVQHTGDEDGNEGKGNCRKIFDYHFQGRLMHLMKVLAKSMEVNFSDFLEEMPLEKAQQMVEGQKTMKGKTENT